MDLRVVLDTNAYCDFRSSGLWRDILAQADQILVPSPVIGELMHGFRIGRHFKQNSTRLEMFLGEPQVDVAQITKRTGEIYGEILEHLQKIEAPLPTNDLWIAALAIEHDAVLITSDRHFSYIPQVKLNLPGE